MRYHVFKYSENTFLIFPSLGFYPTKLLGKRIPATSQHSQELSKHSPSTIQTAHPGLAHWRSSSASPIPHSLPDTRKQVLGKSVGKEHRKADHLMYGIRSCPSSGKQWLDKVGLSKSRGTADIGRVGSRVLVPIAASRSFL